MRRIVYLAAVLAAALTPFTARAAEYTLGASYQYPGQTASNTGYGAALNGDGSRLYVIKRGATDGRILSLDTATGSVMGTVTPPLPTTVTDVAVSADGAALLFARKTEDGDYEIASAPATDGSHGSADVSTVISGIPAPITSIALAVSGTDRYLGIVTSPDFLIYRSAGGGAWTLQSTISIGATSLMRDVAALDTGAGAAFYILRPSFTRAPNVVAYDLNGTSRAVTFAALPTRFEGYTFESIAAAPDVDGEPALFIAAEVWDEDLIPRLTVFRYTATGAFVDEGFGRGFSTGPLADLSAVDADPIPAPMTIGAGAVFVGASLPSAFEGGPGFVKVAIGQSTGQTGRILGTVTRSQPSQEPVEGARVVVAGRSTPSGETGANGAYALGPLSAGPYTVGAWKFGYVAASGLFNVAAGQDTTGADLTLPDTVPAFGVAPAFVPPSLDGWTFPGEYPTDAMPFYLPGGADPDPAVRTAAWATHDEENLYVMVQGGEPSLALNSALATNAQMITLDDNVQIFVDPPHRHDAQAETSRLHQFVVNIPAYMDGVVYGTSYRFQRRVDPDGQTAASLAPSSWQTRVGYTDEGWIVEARIPFTTLGLAEAPAAGAEWGLLVARNRPGGHNDSLPPLSSTSPRQQSALTWPNTWTDARLAEIAPLKPGDVNRNGVVDIADVVFVLRMAGGLSFAGPDFRADNEAYWQAILAVADVAPVGGDGAITLLDAARLVRVAAGQDTLP